VHDKELYQQILGLRTPWVVEGVEVKKESQEVVVHVGLEGPIVLGCPDCDNPFSLREATTLPTPDIEEPNEFYA
jgi:hypothetical protein